MRDFAGESTRSSIEGKPQYFKYFSPLVFKEYGEYMLKHQTQEDKQYREGDNWRLSWDNFEWNHSLLDSKGRHFVDEWLIHDGYKEAARGSEKEALCAQIFGAQSRLHNILHGEYLRAHPKPENVPTVQAFGVSDNFPIDNKAKDV